jgi:hypothetical protein
MRKSLGYAARPSVESQAAHEETCLSQRMRDANLPWTYPTRADLTAILKSVIAAHTSDADNGVAAQDVHDGFGSGAAFPRTWAVRPVYPR